MKSHYSEGNVQYILLIEENTNYKMIFYLDKNTTFLIILKTGKESECLVNYIQIPFFGSLMFIIDF